jgi:two-component system NtrC family sensor kinase
MISPGTPNRENSAVPEWFRAEAGELAQLRARLVQSEKMSAAGNLLAGIVHELNSPLTTILGFSELLLQNGVDESMLEKIRAEAERSVRIIRNVLTVSRGSNAQREVFDVNESIRQTVELAE